MQDGSKFDVYHKTPLILLESAGFYIVSISSSRRFLCLSDREVHLANSVCCSLVSSRGFPSAKNCAKVIPKAVHTASKVGSVGALFLLNIFVTVEWDRPDSFASRYSVQPRSTIMPLIRPCASTPSPSYL